MKTKKSSVKRKTIQKEKGLSYACNMCHKEMLRLAWECLPNSRFNVCFNPECPNYGLYQVHECIMKELIKEHMEK